MKTVLNKKNVPVQDRIMFLGPDLGIQRYDQHKYPRFFELWQQQENYRWRPERIDLSKDRTDYERLTEVEKFVFESNIRWQTMVDSMLSRSIFLVSEYVTNSELEICMGTWASMEQMHSFSYTHIFKNITKNATAFFDSILEDEEIVKRAQAISKSYDDLLGEPKDIKEKILHAVFSTNIVESISFYASFICSFYFGYKGLMEGSAKIISEISRDECLADGTEVLTTIGWKKIQDLTTDDLVLQFNEDETSEFVKPEKIIEHDVDEELVNFKNKKGYVDALITKNHRIIYKNRDCKILDEIADSYNHKNVYHKWFVAAKKNGTIKEFTFWDRLYIAIQADANLLAESNEYRNGAYTDCIPVRFDLTKDRKKERLEWILSNLNLEYTKSPIKNKPNGFSYYVKIPKNRYVKKKFDWVDLANVSHEWCVEFLKEISLWDGHLRYKDFSNIYYSSTVSFNADIVQCIACFAGAKCHRGIQIDNRKESYKDVHRLTIILDKNTISSQCLKKTYMPYKGKVYCLKVPSGAFIVRYNNRVHVTGNCLHVAITQNIIKNWQKYPEEGFIDLLKKKEDEIYALFELSVKNEKDWANYLFSKGSLLGLNADILHNYVEWLANTRLAAIGYKKIFNQKKNPVSGWSTRYFDSSKEQVAPQESELESYLVGSANTQLKDEDFNDITL